jgi:hypothetical protein
VFLNPRRGRILVRSAYIVMLIAVVLAAAMGGAAEEVAQDGGSPPPGNAGVRGEVVETIDTGSYTYVRVDTGEEKVWAAAPRFEVQVGDRVAIPAGYPMPDYYSKTLKRSFGLVHFVSSVSLEGAEGRSWPSRAEGHSGRSAPPPRAAVDLSGISKAADGNTVGEIFDHRDSLANQEVVVRGKVVKFMTRIMGKNWIHLQDGTTGETGADDLTVTTDSVAAVGDTVLVHGVLSINKDFGFGYKYDVIIEDASVTVE